MPPLSALILQASGPHRSAAVTALHHLGYSVLAEVSGHALVLDRLRSVGGVHLLICDVRIDPVPRLEFLQTVAREQLAHGVVVSGEMAPGTWSTLAHLLRLQGMKVFWLGNEPATLERLRALLMDFEPHALERSVSPRHLGALDGADIGRVLERGELRVALQPKVMVATAQIYGFEVLARWHREDGQVLLPDEFLPALRRDGMLDALLFQQMAQAHDALRAHGRTDLELSFNLEPEQIARTDFAVSVECELRRMEINPRNVTFELTESSPLHALPSSLENVLRLRLLGCGLAIDDFGCKHSNLQRLVELPFTELKLDRSFLANLNTGDPRRLIVLTNALALGRELGLRVVAEGVENPSQHRQLQSLGCEAAQGYLFGKPAAADGLSGLLRGTPTHQPKAGPIRPLPGSLVHLAD
ncbi:two-component response regulator [Pseudomonas sp. ATCC 13867]|uniref:EAL domain-containing response regulator n=1 Tax=Pseudomonas sp. ATCC 13867 TaxID=1294143 RepID=UPI0002C4E083|nr:EAL domain-containing protein [Pseudomonas sp. ATCC 13867]AGI24714.1 two-component response regulator [Pseudomonas sp. ATCC 13867]RFQ41822.1 EAL domain-containing protein [Pseudomonas sp. ATCC 13867]